MKDLYLCEFNITFRVLEFGDREEFSGPVKEWVRLYSSKVAKFCGGASRLREDLWKEN